ncbi:hypothetical protein CPT03_20290 [Pedobacter ginsengisoli]|uniref:DUF4286 domain-containing protein n=1 Tax=Pedobacter ginsengisoli TaxID=363852 RepID=A0A2D1UAK3_9SPHI|nr:DUF4286 family protein [Pedobacter ginsengisoli]ATP58637.1 hypothetical protein CPT03_20290 [Pedobacter ginsengisoli]
MLLYNVTTIIEDSSADRWLQWMQEIHIPQVMQTGLFISNRLLKVVDSPNEGVTYCSQYVVEDMDNFLEYQNKFASALIAEVNINFQNQQVSFTSLMEYIA